MQTTGIDSNLNAATFLTPTTAIEMPAMPKRDLADRILDEVASLRRSKALVVEFDEETRDAAGTAQDEIVAPASRRQIIVE